MSDWQTVTLEDVTESINTGLDAIRRAPIVEHKTNLRCLRIQDISQNKPFDKWGYTEVKDSDFKKFQLVPNDIIMARTCSTGICYLVKKELPAVFNNGLARIRLKIEKVDPKFIYYVFKSKHFSGYIDGISGGTSVQLNMKIGDLLKYQFNLPPLSEQKEIARILSDLDKKIQLNTQINQTLEQIAQALFKSWFVDFDPVRAKVQALSDGLSLEQAELAAMQAISGKTPEELTALSQTQPDRYAELAETAKAFPCEMVEVDGVDVPKGWELSTIGEEVETVGGATPSTKEESFWNNGKIAWTTPKDLSSATSPVLINTERKITELGLKKISSGLLPISTVLLSSRAPIGYLALTKIPVAINQGYIAIKCNKTLSNFYMLQWCKENLEEIKSRASGTTFLEISKTTFRGISIIVPEKNILIMFNKQCESIYEIITNHTKENQKLEKVRDLLLPRLLNGEIQL